eukprot:1362254-Rhodomonas_salina.1
MMIVLHILYPEPEYPGYPGTRVNNLSWAPRVTLGYPGRVLGIRYSSAMGPENSYPRAGSTCTRARYASDFTGELELEEPRFRVGRRPAGEPR